MSKQRLFVAFYHYKEPIRSFSSFRRRLVHELTCLLTRAKYSHCELVYPQAAQPIGACFHICDSASGRDGGVRRKDIILYHSRWALVPVYASTKFADRTYQRHAGKKYDYLGALRAVLPFFKQSPQRWYCSEYVAAALNLPLSAGQSPKTLYHYLRSQS